MRENTLHLQCAQAIQYMKRESAEQPEKLRTYTISLLIYGAPFGCMLLHMTMLAHEQLYRRIRKSL